MSDFLRPEARQFLLRWSEPALALAATLMALWVVGWPAISFGWVSLLLGAVILTGGVVWLRSAVMRALRGPGHANFGRVYVEERRILYLGPLGNVQIGHSELVRIEIASARKRGDQAYWLLSPAQGAPIRIPANAEGGESLIQYVEGLKQARLAELGEALRARDGGLRTVWSSPQTALKA